MIAVVGKEEFVLGFKLVGITRCYPVKGDEELEDRVRDLLTGESGVGILIMRQTDLPRLSKRTQLDIEKTVMPVVITVGTEKDTILQDRVKQVMGVDLWT